MTDLRLGQFSYRRGDGLFPSVHLENVFYEKSVTNLKDQVSLQTRPTLRRLANVGAGPGRGIFWKAGSFGGQALAASGPGLWLVGQTGTAALLGAIKGLGSVEVAFSPTVALIASGGQLQQTDGVTVSDKAFPDDQDVASVGFINGYFLAVPVGSHRIYFTDLLTGEFDGTRFISAERYPDDLAKIIVTSDEVWGMGYGSVEVFVPTGVDTSEQPPFQRVEGRLYEKGVFAAATAVKADNTVYWVGQSEDGGLSLYRGDAVPIQVSDSSLAERIKRADPAKMTAWPFGMYGHSFYVLGLGDEGTWALDIATGAANEWSSLNRPQWRAWLGKGVWSGEVLASDIDSGAVWQLDPNGTTDDGTPVKQVVTAGITVSGRPTCSNVSLDCAVGQVAENGAAEINLLISHDQGRTWEDQGPTSLGEHGHYYARVRWDRLGMMVPPNCIFEWTTTSPVRMRISGARINEPF
jgi:hypothetical protein